MDAAYINFGKKMTKKEKDEVSKIMAEYANKLHIVVDGEVPENTKDIEILYNNSKDNKCLYEYINKEVLIVKTFDEIRDILNFYLKYDYKTLKKIWRLPFIGTIK